jgi:hypothetical protein
VVCRSPRHSRERRHHGQPVAKRQQPHGIGLCPGHFDVDGASLAIDTRFTLAERQGDFFCQVGHLLYFGSDVGGNMKLDKARRHSPALDLAADAVTGQHSLDGVSLHL